MKKDSEITRMFRYAGDRHWLTMADMILAGLSTVLSMVPLVISFFCLKQMMGGDNAHFMEGYMSALETMNKEAVEYIRGIPVVKVFQQTVYSFKNFHAAIEEYEKYASGYALKCRMPLTGFNVALNGTFILLIPAACMILAGVSG